MGDYLLKGYKMLAITCPVCGTILLQTKQGENYCIACSELDSDADKDNPVLNASAAMTMAREAEMSATASAVTTPRPSVPPSPRPSQASLPSLGGLRSVSSMGVAEEQEQASLSRQLTPRSEMVASMDSLAMTSIDVQSWPANAGPTLDKRFSQASTRLTQDDVKTEASAHDLDSGVGFVSSAVPVAGPQGEITITALTEKISWATKELSSTGSVEYSGQLCRLIKEASEAVVALRAARI